MSLYFNNYHDTPVSKTKTKLLDRLEQALLDIYHNATPDHCYKYDESLSDTYWDWFTEQAGFELEHIRDNLGRMSKEYQKELKKFQSKERYFYLVSCINDFGDIHTWGRGGRTLAPNRFINTRGGSSFSIKNIEEFVDCSNEDLTHLIQVIEAFNQYVTDWNKQENIAYMWEEECLTRLSEYMDSAKYISQEFRDLATEVKALKNTSEKICETLKEALISLKHEHDCYIKNAVLWKNAF